MQRLGVAATQVAQCLKVWKVRKVLLAPRGSLQTDKVAQPNRGDLEVGINFQAFGATCEVSVPIAAARGAEDVDITGRGREREAITVQDRLLVENEWHTFGPPARIRVKRPKHAYQPVNILSRALVTQVQVRGCPIIPMEIAGQAANDQVGHSRVVQQA